MKPVSIMVIAGDASGDELAAELVTALRRKVVAANASTTDAVQPLTTQLEPVFFGAGGAKMKAAGVDVAFDLTEHSVIGFTRAFKKALVFRQHFKRLRALALERLPDVIIGVDFGGFNMLFGRMIKNYSRKHSGIFQSWKPKIVQYVSPQVWASRPGRAFKLAQSHDLILSIIPFEREWYASRVPSLPVKFVGHPMVDRYQQPAASEPPMGSPPRVVMLPGSRSSELRHHLGLLGDVLKLMRAQLPGLRPKMIFPNDAMVQRAKEIGLPENIDAQVGGLSLALATADLAIAKSGTVAMECGFFHVPTVIFYRLSWLEFQILRRIVTVKWVSMPNLLANESVFPEFIQHQATPENIAAAALELLQNAALRQSVKSKLAKITKSLGEPGAAGRAAEAIVKLLK